MAEIRPFRVGRLLFGLFLVLIAHAIVLGAAGFALKVLPAGGEFGDLASFLTTAIIGEALVLVGSMLAGAILVLRGRKDTGVGLVIGGLLAVVLALLVRFA